MKIIRKITALCMLSLLSASVFANGIESDKVKHVGISAGLGFASKLVIGEEEGIPWKSFGLAMIPGIAKELSDDRRKNGSGFSKGDLLADALGAGIGVYFGESLITFQKEKKGVQISMTRAF